MFPSLPVSHLHLPCGARERPHNRMTFSLARLFRSGCWRLLTASMLDRVFVGPGTYACSVMGVGLRGREFALHPSVLVAEGESRSAKEVNRVRERLLWESKLPTERLDPRVASQDGQLRIIEIRPGVISTAGRVFPGITLTTIDPPLPDGKRRSAGTQPRHKCGHPRRRSGRTMHDSAVMTATTPQVRCRPAFQAGGRPGT